MAQGYSHRWKTLYLDVTDRMVSFWIDKCLKREEFAKRQSGGIMVWAGIFVEMKD